MAVARFAIRGRMPDILESAAHSIVSCPRVRELAHLVPLAEDREEVESPDSRPLQGGKGDAWKDIEDPHVTLMSSSARGGSSGQGEPLCTPVLVLASRRSGDDP